eukprot:COSAG01_NODE_6728_length_3526_cov_3.566093_1_plen_57_part_00
MYYELVRCNAAAAARGHTVELYRYDTFDTVPVLDSRSTVLRDSVLYCIRSTIGQYL